MKNNSEIVIEKLGYSYNELNDEQAKRMLDCIIKKEKNNLKV